MADGDDLARKRVPGTVLAAVLGLSDRRVRQLRDEGFIPETEDGDYELGPAVRGYARFLGSRKPARESAQADLAREQAAEKRRKNLQARGQLLPVELVDETLQGITDAVVPLLDGLGGRLANELAGIHEPAVIRARIQDECRVVRSAVADYLERRAKALAAMREDGAELAPAEEADAVAVGGREREIPAGARGAGSVSGTPHALGDPAAGGVREPALSASGRGHGDADG